MKKHQFAKNDCNCDKRASYFTCIHCKAMEYASPDELERLDVYRAACSAPDAPMVDPAEKFKASMGGSFNCLSPDFDTHFMEEAPGAGSVPADGGTF